MHELLQLFLKHHFHQEMSTIMRTVRNTRQGMYLGQTRYFWLGKMCLASMIEILFGEVVVWDS